MIVGEGILLWKTAMKSRKRKQCAFDDPLERPEWRGLTPLLRLYRAMTK